MILRNPCLLAVGTVFFVFGCPLAAQPQKPTVTSDRTTILTSVAARPLFKQCSRPSPEAVASYWMPTENNVQEAERSLPAFMQTLKNQRGPNRRLRNDYRQYAGFVGKNGHKALYLNAFAPSIKDEIEKSTKGTKKPFNWKRDPMGVCDGGDSFWGAEYDVQTKQWSRFYFNGPQWAD